jgi:hypothetical protein
MMTRREAQVWLFPSPIEEAFEEKAELTLLSILSTFVQVLLLSLQVLPKLSAVRHHSLRFLPSKRLFPCSRCALKRIASTFSFYPSFPISFAFFSDINRLHHPTPSHSSSIALGVSSSGASQLPKSSTASVSSTAHLSAKMAESASHNARLLIISASEEESSGYVSLMNCIFSAQKAVRRPFSPSLTRLVASGKVRDSRR